MTSTNCVMELAKVTNPRSQFLLTLQTKALSQSISMSQHFWFEPRKILSFRLQMSLWFPCFRLSFLGTPFFLGYT